MPSFLISILIFGVIILVHEYGHFIVARKNGIVVEEFAIGLGPLLFGKKVGDTLYSLRAIPMGGYCKMLGAEEGTDQEGSFNSKSVFARIAVISAGSVMNILLSFVLVFILLSVNGFTSPAVRQTIDGLPAQQAGILPGDRIVSVNNTRIFVFDNIVMALSGTADTPIDIVVRRGVQRINLTVTPVQGDAGNTIVGFYPAGFTGLFGSAPTADEVRAGIFGTVQHSFFTTLHYIRALSMGIMQLLTFNIELDDISGFVGIVTMIGDVHDQAMPYGPWVVAASLMNFTALISANLALFNLLPIPALDGGRLVFLFVELVRGKPISPEKEGVVHLISFALLIGLIIVVTFNDILQLLRLS